MDSVKNYIPRDRFFCQQEIYTYRKQLVLEYLQGQWAFIYPTFSRDQFRFLMPLKEVEKDVQSKTLLTKLWTQFM